MKKLVIKTVFITIIAILVTCFAVMSAFCVFKPKVIAKMFEDLGNYKASQYFYQMQYNKTEDINDLLILIDNTYENQNNGELLNYVGKLISHKDFKAFCQNKNQSLGADEMKTEEYYAGLYVELLTIDDSFNKAIGFARSYVVKANGAINLGYTKFNPFRVLINNRSSLLTEQKQTLKQEIQNLLDCDEIKANNLQLGYVQEDIDKLG